MFDSGTVWDADTERTLDALRFVALDAGIIDDPSDGLANEYDGLEQPAAGEVELPDRDEAVASGSAPGHDPYGDTYTWNVRVRGKQTAVPPPRDPTPTRARGAPPAPRAAETGPPDD